MLMGIGLRVIILMGLRWCEEETGRWRKHKKKTRYQARVREAKT